MHANTHRYQFNVKEYFPLAHTHTK